MRWRWRLPDGAVPRPVDLLPWRQNRRRRVLRFWGLMFAALPLMAAALYGRQQAEQIHTQALTCLLYTSDAADDCSIV